jgi:cytochrome c2
MSYNGMPSAQTRADVIAYLNKNSDAPVKLPGA